MPSKPDPAFCHHHSPYLITQRAQCLAVARQLLEPSARKVKVTKRYQRNGSSAVQYSARVVGAERHELIDGGRFRGSEEEAVQALRKMIVENWREKQGSNFF